MRKKLLITVMILIMLILQGCTTTSNEPIKESVFALDTIITITLFEDDPETFDAIIKLIQDYEAMLSAHINGSEVDQINAYAGIPVNVSDQLIELIQQSIDYSYLSGGLFDITIGPLSSLWAIGSDIPNQKPPDKEQILETKSEVDYQKIEIMENTVTIDENQLIDLGGIAKGFIADEIVQLLEERKVKRAILNLGGNVYVHGSKSDGSPYAVGIQNPDSGRGDIIGIIRQSNTSVVTSGLYERYFIHNDILYHHILDPISGYPVDNQLKSVSIISPLSLDGDALSTTLFLLGLDKGYELAESLADIEAIFITKDNQIYLTGGLNEVFELTDDTFTIKE
jgi:thiamine biosynthesis lipoprotein